MEETLVDQSEDGVQDRGIRLEDFVEEGDVRLREFMGSDPAVVVLLQRLEAYGPKDLLRRAEARQEPLEVVGPLDAAADLIGEHRFCGSRRADDQ